MQTNQDEQSDMDEPELDEILLTYYWGADWPGLKSHYSDGTPVSEEHRGFPKWERYSDEQKEEMLELKELTDTYCKQQVEKARLDERKKAIEQSETEYGLLKASSFYKADFREGYFAAIRDSKLDLKDRIAELNQEKEL